MAPIRRYLRISKYSVLECRIFLEHPADGPRWLLSPTDPALPRVFDAIRPLVLPKLREENERARGKGKKKKSVKDVVKRDEFEVAMFLTEIRTRHSLLVKNKTFKERKLPGEVPFDELGLQDDPLIIREESDDEAMPLDRIPSADTDDSDDVPPSKRRKETHDLGEDKKRLAFRTNYDGFTIWGWALCLLVERTDTAPKVRSEGNAQALMQEWITSTQLQDDDG